MEESSKIATERQLESKKIGRQAMRLHFGEIFLEMSIVFASLAILTKRAFMWYLGMAVGALGAALAISTLLVK